MRRAAALSLVVLALQAAWCAGAASASPGDPGQSPCEYPFRGDPGTLLAPPPAGITPAVTNPDVGNPDAITNAAR